MLNRSKRQNVTIRRPRPAVPGNAFEASGLTVSARVLPMSGTATSQMYGLEPSQMRLMMCDKGVDVRQGDGACVDVGASDEPDFRVVYVANWTRHCVAHLKYIPLADRGADE